MTPTDPTTYALTALLLVLGVFNVGWGLVGALSPSLHWVNRTLLAGICFVAGAVCFVLVAGR